MLEIIDDLLGTVPPGLEFLRYFFGFVLVAFGLVIVAYIAHLPIEFIGNRFHKGH